jgi:ferrous iron transport protein B
MKNREIIIGIVGNPNSGKTTIFNALTGARQKVANWSGVTVERREGMIVKNDYRIRIVDLPGIYSLTSYSIEEIITRDFILNDHPDLIVNVVDAGNLERNLYLTTQLIEMGAKVVIALNMFDEATSKGLVIDTEKLEKLLGMPVIKTVGTRLIGISDIKQEIIEIAEGRSDKVRHIHIQYGSDIEKEIKEMQSRIWSDEDIGERYSTRWLAIRLLEQDRDVERKLMNYSNFDEIAEQALKSRIELEKKFNDDIVVILSDMRYGFISGALKEAIAKTAPMRVDISEKIDKVITNRYLGFPILFVFIWALFQLTFSLGEYPMRVIESGVMYLGLAFNSVLPSGPLKDMIIDGIIGGVGSVIVFLPNILVLFMGISFMEDTGYMARAAFIMDKIMHKMGLHGKSFIPLIMGFGCNVPAIMATRSLESRQDRILTILINPFMSCSARLPVYVLFAGIFFREHPATVILSLYMIGIILAFLSARLFKLVFFKGESTPFVMELPPYRMPTLKTTLLHMWDRSSQYLRKMGGIILAFSIVIWVLGAYPKSDDIERRYTGRLNELKSQHLERLRSIQEGSTENSIVVRRLEESYRSDRERLILEKKAEEKKITYIGRFGEIILPILKPLGFNWQMGISLSTGFVAKEVVVSTMGVLYHASASEDPEIAQNSLEYSLKKPEYGITPLIAYVFMLFVLLYVPCLATVVVIGREAGWQWASFSLVYQVLLAWLLCFLVYNLGIVLGL